MLSAAVRGRLQRPPDDAGRGGSQGQGDGTFGQRQGGKSQVLACPARQQGDCAGGQRAVPRPRAAGKRGVKEQEPRRIPGRGRARELGPVGLEPGVKLGNGHRRVEDAEPDRHDGALGHVQVRLGSAQGGQAISLVGAQEAVCLGDVHPRQQVRVAGAVGAAIWGPAAYPLVDPGNRRNEGLRVADGGERRGRQEGAGAL